MDRRNDVASIFEQAERWFARLRSRDCSAAERLAFEAWQAADPAHAAAYDETARLWDELAPLADDAEVAQWRNGAVPGEARHAGRRRAVWGWSAAAGVLLGLAFGGYALWRKPAPAPAATAHYATAAGELRRVTLADGSRLTLNGDTVLNVTMDAGMRDVKLLRGQAVFDVAHEARRPFVVHAAGNAIRDIGTRFDVSLEQAQARINVIEGVVNVTRGARTAMLTRGEELAAGEDLWRQRNVDPDVAIGWTHGMLVFRQTPLDEAVAQANRYGDGRTRLVVADPSLASLPISGDFRIGETDSLVRALQSAFPIQARHDRASGETRLYRR
ncbi:hypothetical protein ASG87_05130 [Frateuria sp. Soil773]|uniref:FecR family protein n=1 Tax=Frateuria sp. Soil773 TaxID=1736407 RepID=UPI0006F98A05|nr:FecR domain-containing protein [Frateuria sp. Soil773]KRE88945.1 hypothetical protein ASG87_05130 [Frateuria sp. Soil773]